MPGDQRTPVHPVLRSLGRELKLARERRGFSQQDLAKEIHFSDSLISAVETGRRPASSDLIYRADDALNTDGLLRRLLEAAQEAANQEMMPEWFRPWREIEQAATALRFYQQFVVSGLLQTPDYARAVLRAGMTTADEAALQRATDARIQRQHILTRETPPQLIMILEESALHRPVGSPEVMRDQLAHLIDIATAGRVELHILPTDIGAHRGMSGTFVLATLPDAPEIAYLDSQLRGLVIESPADVEAVRRTWEGLLGESLPQRLSLNLIKEAAQAWTI
ncbi:helix-turn-helix domain-containing protein [Catenuloplanes atrovinosus]|uniref:Transcriptional regulator with XRE-family HTH domain n=1 Tax=Catenuloplanes atrovinosus TaxID=137266 RepID=A0AAE4CE85_9ACTN|nr:helix-turn-helix transcriptional regulator [Catenuloplanes atrovinosus]MDR7279809.1 transcriptional regulator with XRE-family HTH domain [Catenuloplanes atrovinosus]